MLANGADHRRAWARRTAWLLAVAAVGHGAARVCEAEPPHGVEQALRDALAPLVAAHEGTVAAAVRHLGTGASYAHAADRPMPLASLVKVPVMVAAYAAAHEGRISLDDRLTFSADDVVPGSVVIDKLSPGATFTLRDAVRMMIASSDNTATNLVIRRIGLPATNDVLDRIGLPGIRLNSLVYRRESSLDPERSRTFGLGNGTADDFIALMGRIHDGDLERDGVVAKGACAAMLDHLLACEDRGTAGRDLPAGVKVAHKTGLVSGVRTDAGVILGPAGPLAFCVLTKDNRDRKAPHGPADDLIARFARAAVDAVDRTGSEGRGAGPQCLAAGASGRLVEDLQRSLNVRLPEGERLGVDGEFGPATTAGVRAFQKLSSLPETGVVDAATWAALGPLASAAEPPAPLPGLEPADDPAGPPVVTAAAWAVVDGATGELLLGHNADEKRHQASVTKIMTALVVLERAAAVPGALDEWVRVSTRAGTETGSTAQLRPGDRVTVRDLLHGLLLPSGNDAAVALAEHVAAASAGDGDPLDRFVAAMNARAASLGLRHTTYGNPHGLTVEGCVSTPREVAAVAREALRQPLFREIVATRRRTIRLENLDGYARDVVWNNTNKLLGIEGYDGIKTGTTTPAGCCLASSGERGGRRLIVVVLGSTSTEARYADTRNLFRHAWRTLGVE
jgi:D-alanyl-D-alanine carboxypeptidase (penicillin-binding protein 5/6)